MLSGVRITQARRRLLGLAYNSGEPKAHTVHHRPMKLVIVLLLAITAAPAWAQPWDGRGRPDRERGPRQDFQPGPHRGPPPDRRMERDERREGALSEEERRGLHRDLDRANRELYRR